MTEQEVEKIVDEKIEEYEEEQADEPELPVVEPAVPEPAAEAPPVIEPEPEPPTVEEPVIEPTIPEPEPEPIKEPIMLKPIIEYPAYIIDQCGTLWGIPLSLMGEGHKERVKIETVDGVELPTSSVQFFTSKGVAYFAHTYTDEKGKSCVDYYAQEFGLKTPKVELVDSIPSMPEQIRAALDSPEWLIESTVISGTEWSYLYNRNAAVWGGAGKGEWICRKEKITGYAVLSSGIVVMSEAGGEFCPSNRKGLNAVSEPGRLWK